MQRTSAFLLFIKTTCAFLFALWAGFPLAIHMLVAFMGLDLAAGLVAAAATGKVSSNACLRGLVKKIAVVVALLFVHQLDGLTGMELGLEKIFAFYLCINESISVLENLTRAGVQFPAPIVDMLMKMKQANPAAATPGQLEKLASDMRDADDNSTPYQKQ